ncbi:HAMP domain-containing sensor histidine kinase [Bacillus paranthracis]|uniref:HAMP domain-containing sensor histidine kinase n=1 Tax=Bacillus cereus group TaxID=86661 RepID=UPI0007758396|nr:HAMP domain-containing sensor histidine kinase [Bacillus cereus group sp. Bc253]KXO04355.1 histidine kinase [Bacillus thuringiensis]MDA2157706.1 HAMP domain-containing sensor histidine kinase [Bacillus cereus group sp. Bc253]
MRMFQFKNKLVAKLLFAVGISFIISFGVIIITILTPIYNHLSPFYSILTFFSVIIFTFIGAFLLLMRKKLLYLKLITESVHDIANGELGLTIRIDSEDELALLAQNINYMSKELETKFEYERKLERTKNELITNVSHDLRTPLTSIIGYLDLLKKGKYNDKKQLQEYIETIYSKSQRLKHSIDELFEYTRVSSPDVKLNLNKVDLTGLLQQIVGEYIPIFEKKHLNVQTSIPNEEIIVFIDIEKIVRVYENLFINAIKYSLKPSELSIHLECVGNKAILKISNTAEKPLVGDANKLFERFFTGDKARMSKQGTGIGLAISKRIVELHNGNIYAKYKDGRMTFVVEHSIYRHEI